VLAALLCAPAASALSLQEAQRAMEAHNPDLRAAALELRGVQGDAQTAALRPATELSIGTSKISPKHGIGPGRWQDKRVDSTVGLGWTWERGGKRALRIRQADALLEVAGLEMLDTRRRQQVALHEAYFGLKGAQERAQIAEANRQSSAEQMAAADKQVATGAMAPVDRARLAVDDLAVADAAREAALDLRDARHALGLLLGRDDSHDLSADDPWPDPAAGSIRVRSTRSSVPICARHVRAWPPPTPAWRWRAASAIATSSWVWRPSASRPTSAVSPGACR
jgi:cobalt-zinc-cadmium efflux system outer membrane protein